MHTQHKLPFPKWYFLVVATIMLLFILILTYKGVNIRNTVPDYTSGYLEYGQMLKNPKSKGNTFILTKTSMKKLKHQQCSLSFLQNYLAETGEYFRQGNWEKGEWKPTGCVMPRRINASELIQCLERKNIRKFGILGDSQSMKYASSIRRGEGVFRCKAAKSENGGNRSPSIGFFSPPIAKGDLRSTTRDCLGCGGLQAKCYYPYKGSSNSTYIIIENIISENVKDSELVTRRSGVYKNCDARLRNKTGIFCLESSTTQEVIFQEYWCLDGFPDVINIYAVHVHESARRNERIFERDFTWFVNLITSVVPNTTRILYWNAPKVTPPPPHREAWRSDGRNIFIDKLNKISASVIQRFLVERKVTNLYPMYDMLSLSANRSDWSADGVHFKPPWYMHTASLLWTTLCSE